MADFKPTKDPYVKTEYTEQQLTELIRCSEDPFYFIENFVYIQTDKGVELMKLFPFQRDIIDGYHNHKDCIVLTARQQGKCLDYDTLITMNGKEIKIGDLINLNWKQRLVHKLEKILIKLSL